MKQIPKAISAVIREALSQAWEEGHSQGMTDGASYDMGGKYRGNPYK